MKIVSKLDENSVFLEDVIIGDDEETPPGCIEERPPDGFHSPRWDGSNRSWVEGADAQELSKQSLDAAKEAKKAEMTEAAGIEQISDPTSEAGLQTMKAMLSRTAGITLATADITLAKAQREAVMKLQAKHAEVESLEIPEEVEAVEW